MKEHRRRHADALHGAELLHRGFEDAGERAEAVQQAVGELVRVLAGYHMIEEIFQNLMVLKGAQPLPQNSLPHPAAMPGVEGNRILCHPFRLLSR